jgi:hypothetical protein
MGAAWWVGCLADTGKLAVVLECAAASSEGGARWYAGNNGARRAVHCIVTFLVGSFRKQ